MKLLFLQILSGRKKMSSINRQIGQEVLKREVCEEVVGDGQASKEFHSRGTFGVNLEDADTGRQIQGMPTRRGTDGNRE